MTLPLYDDNRTFALLTSFNVKFSLASLAFAGHASPAGAWMVASGSVSHGILAVIVVKASAPQAIAAIAHRRGIDFSMIRILDQRNRRSISATMRARMPRRDRLLRL